MDTRQTAKAIKLHSKKSKKPVHSVKIRSKTFDCKNFEHLDRLEGLKKIKLSPLAQKFIGCKVGEHITTDKPWAFVDKEKIEDHVEFYESNSEFFPIIDDISKFPSSQILVGAHSYIQDDTIDFYVSVSLLVQDTILKSVENEKQARHLKILNSFTPKCGKWYSLGSESEVRCELNKNLRPLIVVDLEGCLPFTKEKVRFVLKNVDKMRDGYIELIESRSSGDMIMRKRIHTGSQASPMRINIGVQSIMRTFCQKSIQCSLEYNKIDLTNTLLKNLLQFVLTKLKEFDDVFKLNSILDLYFDDYKYLKKDSAMHSIEVSTEIKSYQDVINCRRLQISCFTWNAIISGYVAAAHMKTPMFCIQRSSAFHNIEFETVFQEHLILIWHYSDNVQPKLFLHASRDVTALSFCPYNAYILVAGYTNGQIAVWDLTNKLDAADMREFLTDIQERNRMLIRNDTEWFKTSLDDKHVYPTLCCDMENGHRSMVSTIEWIPSSKYIAPERTYKDSDENEPHMQFITASVDGQRILIWDLRIPNNQRHKKLKKKCVRLTTKPKALTQNISPLTIFKKNFEPVCRLILRHLGYPITSILVQRQLYDYKAQNPKSLDDIEARTFFTVSETGARFDYTSRFVFTTGIGTFHEATWEPSEYDPKFYAINEKCTIKNFSAIHDGPIFLCEANPYLPNVVLTLGGSVLAIWDFSKLKIPLFWRKTNYRYVSGMWCNLHPLAFIVVRNDTSYEIWNICERSILPSKVYKFKGYHLTKVYKDTSRTHVRKKTCVITDNAGAFKVFTVPTEVDSINFDLKESEEYLERVVKRKQNIAEIIQNFKNRQLAITNEEPEKDVFVENPKEKTVTTEVPIKKVVPLTRKQRWDLKLEKSMSQILFTKKRIDLAEVEKNKKILQKIETENHAMEIKSKKRISKRDLIFKRAKGQVLVDNAKVQKPRRSTTVDYLTKCDVRLTKESYFNEYLKIEKEVIDSIKHNVYHFEFNWPQLLEKHKDAYNCKQRFVF